MTIIESQCSDKILFSYAVHLLLPQYSNSCNN